MGLVFLLLGEGSVPEHTVQFWSRCNGCSRAILGYRWHFKVPDQPPLVPPGQVDGGGCRRVLSTSAQHQPMLAGGRRDGGPAHMPSKSLPHARSHFFSSTCWKVPAAPFTPCNLPVARFCSCMYPLSKKGHGECSSLGWFVFEVN